MAQVGNMLARTFISKSTWPLVMLFSAVLLSCTSERESQLVNGCTEHFLRQGHANSKISELVSKRDPEFLLIVLQACRTKVDFFLDGYRVQPILEADDPISAEPGVLRRYYKRKLKCDSNPKDCD